MLPKSLRIVACLFLFLFAWSREEVAAATFVDSFSSWNEDRWVASYAAAPAVPVIAPVTTDGHTYLQFRRTRSNETPAAAANSFFYYKGSEDFVANGMVADFDMEVIIRMGDAGSGNPGTGNVGFAFRSQAADYLNNLGYYLAVDFKNSKLTLYKDPVSHVNFGTFVTSATAPTLAMDTDYKLTLHVNGTSIIASLWAIDGTNPLATFSINDATYTNGGYFGLRVNMQELGQNAAFRDLRMEAVPEASSVALLGAAAIGLLYWRRLW